MCECVILKFCRTGTEEQQSELVTLLEELRGCMEAGSVPIIQETNADETDEEFANNNNTVTNTLKCHKRILNHLVPK